MKFGEFSIGGKLGGWNIVNVPATSLPEALESAVTDLFGGKKLGASYVPIWYVGTQLVNGTNHMLICKQTKQVKDAETHIVAVVINIPAGDVRGEKASIVEVINDAELIEGTTPDMNLLENFKKATEKLLGVDYTPVLFLGQQVVRGTNYSFVAEAKTVRPNAEPYAVVMTINVFQEEALVIRIEPLMFPVAEVQDDGVLGYAFPWLKPDNETHLWP